MNMSLVDLDEKSINSLTDIADLEDRGFRVVESLAGDVTPTEQTKRLLDTLEREKKESFYSDVLFYLTSERFAEGQAKLMWSDIMNHKYFMSERIGRNVGVRITAIDYLLNVRKLIHAPRVIKSSDFTRTVKMARTDPLTGLFNRRYFIDQANRVLEAANRLKAPVTLLMADLDRFKKFNDTHGHQAGDLLLQEIARIVRGCIRNSDVVSRYGGDELAFLLPKAAKDDALPVAEKIRSQVQENCEAMNVAISIGLAQYPMDATSRDDLISVADDLLYRAKEFGGNQVCYMHPVRFHLTVPGEAQSVSVVGDFNNWNKRNHAMNREPGSHHWHLTVALKPGRYRYKFLVNNADWVVDPNEGLLEDDGFGGLCAVLVVK